MEDHQNIADDINQSQKYALNRTIIAFVQFGDSVQSRGLMVVAHGGRSDIGQRFITQMDILESEILMTLGYVLKKNVVILYVVIYLIRMAYTNYKRRFNIFYGWYMVAAGTLLMATCFGISYSFSVYFPALQSDFPLYSPIFHGIGLPHPESFRFIWCWWAFFPFSAGGQLIAMGLNLLF
jgi:hypothetical protein